MLTLRLLFTCFVLNSFISFGFAKSIIRHAEIRRQHDTLWLDLDNEIQLPRAIQTALYSGISLDFYYQFELKSTRWYNWLNLASVEKHYLVSYKRLGNIYSVTNPVTLEKSEYQTLSQVIEDLQKLRDFPLFTSSELSEKKIRLKIRFRLNTNDLPAFIQLEQWIKSDWKIDSPWYVIDFVI